VDEVAAFLRAHPPFDALPEPEVERLASAAEVAAFAPGETIFAQGSAPPDHVWAVHSGAAVLRDCGRVLDLLGPGELFGYAAMLAELPTGFAARAAAATVSELAAGRFILGLGVSHAVWVEGQRHHEYGRPRAVLDAYLSGLEECEYRAPEPSGRPPVVLAALRRGLLELARDRTQGAFPYLTPLEGVVRARQILDGGPEPVDRGVRPWLIASLAVSIGPDDAAARDAARAYVANYCRLPAYVAALREHGFGDEDLSATPSERLVDALVATGDRDAVVDRIRAFLDAGADQVAIVPLRPDGTPGSLDTVETLAPPW